MDDKCPSCGEWTLLAFEEYGGRYNDGTEMDYCDCGYVAEDDDEAEAVLWDLGALPASHPFAA